MGAIPEGGRIMADGKKAVVVGGIMAAIAALILATRAKAAPPPPPDKANLYGVVTDASTGNAILGVLVTLNGMTTYTDGNGNYAFTNLDIGGYYLILQKEEYKMASQDIVLYAGDNLLDGAMSREWARLFGTVTDADTGAPLAGVNVTLWDVAETEMLLSAFTDSGGNFSMEHILPGNYVVYFSKDGYETLKR